MTILRDTQHTPAPPLPSTRSPPEAPIQVARELAGGGASPATRRSRAGGPAVRADAAGILRAPGTARAAGRRGARAGRAAGARSGGTWIRIRRGEPDLEDGGPHLGFHFRAWERDVVFVFDGNSSVLNSMFSLLAAHLYIAPTRFHVNPPLPPQPAPPSSSVLLPPPPCPCSLPGFPSSDGGRVSTSRVPVPLLPLFTRSLSLQDPEIRVHIVAHGFCNEVRSMFNFV